MQTPPRAARPGETAPTRSHADLSAPPSGTPAPRRIVALDVARGIAILGTFGTNVWIFTDPYGIVGYLASLGHDPWPQRLLEQLTQGKFLGVLTLMFGVGLAIQADSARRAGRPWPGSYRVRAALLLLDGLAHFLLVAEFDVLTGYALVSMIVCGLVLASERVQRRVAAVAVVAHLALTALVLVALTAAGPPESGSRAPDDAVVATGSWWDLVLFRLDNALAFRAETIYLIPLTVALFLGGAALYRHGLFSPDGGPVRRRALIVGAIAAPLDAATGLFGGDAGVFAARYLLAPVVAIGLLALVAHVYARRDTAGTVGAALGRVGRTALSCYVLQNLVASAVCYGWGLGLAARVDPQWRVPFTVALFVGVATVLVVASRLWLRRFARGPVEWAWHASYAALTRRARS